MLTYYVNIKHLTRANLWKVLVTSNLIPIIGGCPLPAPIRTKN